jgi:hypothetical protein
MESSLYIDEMGQKIYRSTHNDEHINIHNSNILQAWRENVDFQLVLSHYAVLKYITKYASKAEGRSETYHHMLTRIESTSNIDDPVSTTYHNLHLEAIVDRDISAQETFHMHQKLPHVTCSHTFTKLNVGRKIFRRISYDLPNCLYGSTFIDAYLIRQVFFDPVCVFDLTKHYNQARKNEKWKKRNIPAIVHVWPLFTTIPNKYSDKFFEFYCSDLILYKPLHSFSEDIGLSNEDIVSTSETIRDHYHVWNVDCIPMPTPNDQTSEDEYIHTNILPNMEMNER